MAKFEHEVKIDASTDVVWSVLNDPALWPTWFDAVDTMNVSGSIAPSGTFRWQNGNDSGTGVFTQVQPGEVLAFEMQEGDKRSQHTIRLRRAGGIFGGNDTGLEYVMEYDVPGGFLGNFVVGGNPFDEGKVARVAERVKELAEQQAKSR